MTDEKNTHERTAVAFLGLGAMGARMASRLLSDDLDLRVWSRSGVPQRTPLLGAVLARTPVAAVKDADVVIAMVADDEASRAVWMGSGALHGMRRGAIVIECSTLSPSWAAKLGEHAREVGLAFVDAPVVGSRPQADAGGLIFLAGGDAAVLERLRPTLLRMGNAVHHVGTSPAGAYTKLIANALFTVQVAAVGELLGFARRARLDVGTLMQVLAGLPVMSPAAKGAVAGMLAGTFAPIFPLRLAAKDLRYATAEAAAVVSNVPMTCLASEVFERACARGLSEENLTTVAKLYVED
ncbi:MAG TPA: NAD(P)-dependent oxidoreductase [Kofleriaceae bacterium]|nr:NAD(P)-dependent oxidoreductase [Kofleriaceae bacterium]